MKTGSKCVAENQSVDDMLKILQKNWNGPMVQLDSENSLRTYNNGPFAYVNIPQSFVEEKIVQGFSRDSDEWYGVAMELAHVGTYRPELEQQPTLHVLYTSENGNSKRILVKVQGSIDAFTHPDSSESALLTVQAYEQKEKPSLQMALGVYVDKPSQNDYVAVFAHPDAQKNHPNLIEDGMKVRKKMEEEQTYSLSDIAQAFRRF